MSIKNLMKAIFLGMTSQAVDALQIKQKMMPNLGPFNSYKIASFWKDLMSPSPQGRAQVENRDGLFLTT